MNGMLFSVAAGCRKIPPFKSALVRIEVVTTTWHDGYELFMSESVVGFLPSTRDRLLFLVGFQTAIAVLLAF
jgi:hypothetical protein